MFRKLFTLITFVMATLAVNAGFAFAQTPVPPLPPELVAAKPINILPADPAKDFVFKDTVQKVTPASFVVDGQLQGKPLFRGNVVKGSINGFGVQVAWANAQSVKKGDVMFARFVARALKARQESGEAEGVFYFQRQVSPWEKSINQTFSVGPDWTLINVPFVMADDFEAGQAAAFISFGSLEQTLEISGLEVWNFQNRIAVDKLPITRFNYAGREANAQWRKDALKRIEDIRTSPVTIKVVDGSGKPIKGAKIELALTQPEFLWGSSVSSDYIQKTGPDADRYRKEIVDLFDTTVIENGLKWGGWVNQGTRERALKSLDWLRAQDKRVKGHNLIWPAWKFSPQFIKDDPERGTKIKGLAEAHVIDITQATKGKLIGWDVVNEPVHETDYFKHMPREEVANWFKLAEKSDPNLKLTLNEYAMLNRSSSPLMIADFLEFSRMLKANGARVDILGVQGHVGQTPRPPASVLTDLDLLAVDGQEIQITEFDMNTKDEALQADYTRDFLIALYSHKSVTGFVMWGFWQGQHWKPDAAMYRTDWSEKPNLKVWRDLVLTEWKTRVSATSSATGELKTRGHHGRYKVTASLNGKMVSSEFNLKKDAKSVQIILK